MYKKIIDDVEFYSHDLVSRSEYRKSLVVAAIVDYAAWFVVGLLVGKFLL